MRQKGCRVAKSITTPPTEAQQGCQHGFRIIVEKEVIGLEPWNNWSKVVQPILIKYRAWQAQPGVEVVCHDYT